MILSVYAGWSMYCSVKNFYRRYVIRRVFAPCYKNVGTQVDIGPAPVPLHAAPQPTGVHHRFPALQHHTSFAPAPGTKAQCLLVFPG